MSPFQYLLTFLAIIIGLGIRDMLRSLHRLLVGPRITWHWMPPLWAIAVFLSILAMWILNFSLQDEAGPIRYLRGSALSCLLFLLSSAAFPDRLESREEGGRLREHFEARWRYMGILWTLFFVTALASPVVAESWGSYEGWAVSAMILIVAPTALTSRLWYHTGAMLLVIANALILIFR